MSRWLPRRESGGLSPQEVRARLAVNAWECPELEPTVVAASERSRRSRSGRLALVAATVVVGLAVVGGAFAYFTSHGSGTGTAAAGSVTAVTLSPGTPSMQLDPGGAADVAVQVSNPNSIPVRIASIALDASLGTSGFSVNTGHSGCDLSVLSFPTDSTGWTVPAGASTLDLLGDLHMSTAAANDCQGASFTVYLKAGP